MAWQWARLAMNGRRYLGVYGADEHGWVFHAVLDLAMTPEAAISHVARGRNYEATDMWRLGPHESITLDERLPPQLLAMNRLVYDDATPEQTIVLVLTRAELRFFGLPEMDT
jgi:hypothetical protein